jgi:hypothetical protein
METNEEAGPIPQLFLLEDTNQMGMSSQTMDANTEANQLFLAEDTNQDFSRLNAQESSVIEFERIIEVNDDEAIDYMKQYPNERIIEVDDSVSNPDHSPPNHHLEVNFGSVAMKVWFVLRIVLSFASVFLAVQSLSNIWYVTFLTNHVGVMSALVKLNPISSHILSYPFSTFSFV